MALTVLTQVLVHLEIRPKPGDDLERGLVPARKETNLGLPSPGTRSSRDAEIRNYLHPRTVQDTDGSTLAGFRIPASQILPHQVCRRTGIRTGMRISGHFHQTNRRCSALQNYPRSGESTNQDFSVPLRRGNPAGMRGG
ncbi:hypothetical protein E4U54_005127 [Claviceps lovelessii]|nr:hypothetical protein E4U54_005127 [Claviceps lovelessii]